ncbi:hypothetical protein [Sulfuricurvum sp.]|uniref:hypothetical protein n=1 Tax=Sulfuricurvum sp. TaxID=2025608 RepID=UPI003567C58B
MPKASPSNNKSVSARQRINQGTMVAAMLRGDRGTGKTRFILDLHMSNVQDAYKKIYNEELNWETSDKDQIKDAAEHCLMCVVDFDMEGQEQLIMRSSIMPDEITDSWHKWPVTGSPEDSPEDQYEHRFDEGKRALSYYLQMLKEHHEKYPDFSQQRVLIVEDLGEVYDAVLDHFFFITTRGKIKTFKDQFVKQTTLKQVLGRDEKGKGPAEAALFPMGQRETFGMVNLEYKDFIRECVKYKRDMGYNFYCTARIGVTKDKETEKTEEYTLGRTYLIEGFLDLIISFKKPLKESVITEGKFKGKKVYESMYVLDTVEGAKNRMSPDFWMENTGAGDFFRRLNEERDKDERRQLNKRNKKQEESNAESTG